MSEKQRSRIIALQTNASFWISSHGTSGFAIHAHTSWFGEDHGASSRHSIAKEFSGTILFIETKVVLHDALVPCIGGILGFCKL